ncbi:unnamed protein product [Urochloa humidicola]
MRYLPKSFVDYLVLKLQDQVLSETAKMDTQLNLHSKLKMDCCIHLKRKQPYIQQAQVDKKRYEKESAVYCGEAPVDVDSGNESD